MKSASHAMIGCPNSGAGEASARQHARGGGTAVRLVLSLLLLLFLPYTAADGRSSAIASTATPAKIEAAFMRNFAHYLAWPVHAFDTADAPWRVCVYGTDPFGDALEATFLGRVEQGRPFVIVRTQDIAALKSCQLAFIGHDSAEARRRVLAELADHPVLTLGHAPAFLAEGGIVRFDVTDRVAFGVNLDRAQSASIGVPTKVLEVAHEVLEHGSVRRRK